jgi:hypothetical protein
MAWYRQDAFLSPYLAAMSLAAFLAILSPGVVLAAEAEATPQRPSLSFNTSTVLSGAFEMEWGGLLTEEVQSVPAFLKFGATDRVELEMGFDSIRSMDLDGEPVTSRGDLVLGVRTRHDPSWDGPSIAWVGWVKAPTARDSAGSGEVDAGVIGIASGSLGRGSLDLNLGFSALGQPDGGTVGQAQLIATVGLPAPAPWSVYVEGAWQRTATHGDGSFFDAGLGYAASPRAVLDLAAGFGSSRGYPDWVVHVGWTILAHTRR